MIYATIQGMVPKEWRRVLLATVVLLLFSSLPYVIAWIASPEDARFTGLLFNPQDGNSYIAKMRQGLEGSCKFRLPYTAEPHDGAPVYLFYLFLGHVARWTGLPLIVLYHAARLVGGAAMLLAIYGLAGHVSENVGERRAMFLLAALGSGLGWLVVFSGYQTADLWVPEAFPVYALLANAHFPLSIALMIWIADCGLRIAGGGGQEAGGKGQEAGGKGQEAGEGRWVWRGLGMAVAAVVLGAIQPFGLVAVFGGLAEVLVERVVRRRSIPWRLLAWVAIAGAAALPYPLYMLRSLDADPVLAAWTAQNETLSPPLWDWALSYGLVLVLAVPGIVSAARRDANIDRLLIGWTLVTLVGMYLPLPLQRRLSLGLGVPLGLLAGMGWWRVVRPRIKARRRGLAQGLAVAFCTLTPLFLIVGHLLTSDAYLGAGEWAALAWLRDEGEPDAMVLCSTRLGLFVPAWAGQPVVYGHPFETVNADEREAQVEAFWAGEMDAEERKVFLEENNVGYVLADAETGNWRLEIGDLVFEESGIRIYAIKP